MSYTIRQEHPSSIQISAARITQHNFAELLADVQEVLATKPGVHNVVLHIRGASKTIEDFLTRNGFRKQNTDYFVYVVKPLTLTGCSNFLQITATNVHEYAELLPAIADLCPAYFDLATLTDLLSSDVLCVLLNAKGVPCAAALTSWSGGVVTVDFLCALVKGAGKKLFDRIVDLACMREYGFLTLKPAAPKLKDVYVAWMGDKLVGDNGEYLIMRTCDDERIRAVDPIRQRLRIKDKLKAM